LNLGLADAAFPGRPKRVAPRHALHGAMADLWFRRALATLAGVTLAVAALVAWTTFQGAQPALHAFGWRFLWTTEWDPVADKYGALPYIFGTLVSSALAMLIALPLGIGTAVFLAELAPRRLANAVAPLIELLAAIPSIVYGLWGVFALAPWLRVTIEPWLIAHLGFLPLFRGFPFGLGMLNAGIVLAVMIVPTISSISREVLLASPRSLSEAALALGATRVESIGVTLHAARAGVLGAGILALGRALGETMAVTMVIGNSNHISASLLAPGATLSSVIANEFTEATGTLYLSALTEIALVLLAVTVVVNAIARWLVYWSMGGGRGARGI
jgi:phosphate transport system permease protein